MSPAVLNPRHRRLSPAKAPLGHLVGDIDLGQTALPPRTCGAVQRQGAQPSRTRRPHRPPPCRPEHYSLRRSSRPSDVSSRWTLNSDDPTLVGLRLCDRTACARRERHFGGNRNGQRSTCRGRHLSICCHDAHTSGRLGPRARPSRTSAIHAGSTAERVGGAVPSDRDAAPGATRCVDLAVRRGRAARRSAGAAHRLVRRRRARVPTTATPDGPAGPAPWPDVCRGRCAQPARLIR